MRMYGVCMALAYGAMALGKRIYGVCRRWCALGVYGVQALGVRMVYVVYVSCGVRCVYVVYIDL